MYGQNDTVFYTLATAIIVHFIFVVGFTVGPSALCPNNGNATCTDGDHFSWDTISEMITRDKRVRHGFAVFLCLSAFLMAFVVGLMLDRLDYYYIEVHHLGLAALAADSPKEFKDEVSARHNTLGQAVYQKIISNMTQKEFTEKKVSIAQQAQILEPYDNAVKRAGDSKLGIVISTNEQKETKRSFSIASPLSFYDKKKFCVWLVFVAAMIPYIGFGIYSTDDFTVTHTNLAKTAFTLLILMCLLLTHLNANHFVLGVFGFGSAMVFIAGCVVAGLGYAIWSDYWWEYILVVCLHGNLLLLSKFDAWFKFETEKISVVQNSIKNKANLKDAFAAADDRLFLRL